MTTANSIVTTKSIQQVNSISMVLLSMSDHYDLPESVKSMIMELNDCAETLQYSSVLNEYVHLLKITS